MTKELRTFGNVLAIDSSPLAVKYSQKRGNRVLKASVTKLPFENNTFDLVISVDVIYHQNVKDDQKAVHEFTRVLKDKGLLILKVPAYDWLRGQHDIVVHTQRRYTTKSLARLLSKEKFTILKLSYVFCSLVLPAIIKRVFSINRNKIGPSDVKMPHPFLNSILTSILEIEINLLKYFSFPFGLSVIAVSKKNFNA